MDNKKNGIPKLRFPGFTGAWEQRKLGEVATRVTRKNKNLESTLPPNNFCTVRFSGSNILF